MGSFVGPGWVLWGEHRALVAGETNALLQFEGGRTAPKNHEGGEGLFVSARNLAIRSVRSVPFLTPFWGRVLLLKSTTAKSAYQLILTSLLEDLKSVL